MREHVGKAIGGQVGNEVLFEGLVQLAQVAGVALQRQHGIGAAADAFGQLGQCQRQRFAVVDDLAVLQAESTGPLAAPGFLVGFAGSMCGPAQLFFQRSGDVAEF